MSNPEKTPITIGMGWEYFTSAEKQELLVWYNTWPCDGKPIELAQLPFIAVDDFIPSWVGVGIPLAKKLLALRTGHLHKLKATGARTMNLSCVWDELTLPEKRRLLVYLGNQNISVTLATLPFVNLKIAWRATPITDFDLLGKLRYWGWNVDD